MPVHFEGRPSFTARWVEADDHQLLKKFANAQPRRHRRGPQRRAGLPGPQRLAPEDDRRGVAESEVPEDEGAGAVRGPSLFLLRSARIMRGTSRAADVSWRGFIQGGHIPHVRRKKTTLLLLAGALALPGLAAAAGPIPTLPVSAIQRRALTAHVAEYSFTVRVGSGPYDRDRHSPGGQGDGAERAGPHRQGGLHGARRHLGLRRRLPLQRRLAGGAGRACPAGLPRRERRRRLGDRLPLDPGAGGDDRLHVHAELGDRAGRPRPRRRARRRPLHPRDHRQRLGQADPARLEPRRPDQLCLPERRDPASAGPAAGQELHPGGHLPEDGRRRSPAGGL